MIESISAEIIRAIPDPKYPFDIYCDSSNTGTGCVLVNRTPDGNKIISFNSRCFDTTEQKLPTIMRELVGVQQSLETYKHLIIGSPFPITGHTDHKPILYLFGKKGQINHRFHKAQLVFLRFNNLKIVQTEGKKLEFPDLLSRNLTMDEIQKQQLFHKHVSI